MLIIGVTGLPSSGKGEFSRIAAKYNFTEIIMGDVIRSQLKKRNLEVNRENSNYIMVELRKERGDNVVAEITQEAVAETIERGYDRILIDGIRSLAEVNYFKQIYPDLIVIAIHANPETRYQRSKMRQRQDDAYSRMAFDQRDLVELSVGIAEVIALADILISSPPTLEEAKMIYAEVINEIILSKSEIGVMNG